MKLWTNDCPAPIRRKTRQIVHNKMMPLERVKKTNRIAEWRSSFQTSNRDRREMCRIFETKWSLGHDRNRAVGLILTWCSPTAASCAIFFEKTYWVACQTRHLWLFFVVFCHVFSVSKCGVFSWGAGAHKKNWVRYVVHWQAEFHKNDLTRCSETPVTKSYKPLMLWWSAL